MKKSLIIVMLFVSIIANAQLKIGGFEFTEDKTNHMLVTAVIGYGTTFLTWKITKRKTLSYAIGVVVPILVGHFKEVYDSKNGGYYNNEDLLADCFGGFTGATISFCILIPSIPLRDKSFRKKTLPSEYSVSSANGYDISLADTPLLKRGEVIK